MHLSLVLSPVSSAPPFPNSTLSVLDVLGAPLRLSRRLGAGGGERAEEVDAVAVVVVEGTILEVEGWEVLALDESDLIGATEGDPGPGDGEGRAEPSSAWLEYGQSGYCEKNSPLGLITSPLEALGALVVPTSTFHFLTMSLAKSATPLSGFCRSLLTATPILVSCRRELGSGRAGQSQ